MGLHIGEKQFQKRVDRGLEDGKMRSNVRAAQQRLQTNRKKAADELGDWESWRNLGEEIRRHTIEHLDYYLEQLSDNVVKRGGKVFFAQTKEEANEYILQVIRSKEAKKVVKAKSMVTEEIGLNEVLEEEGCDVVESDLGEYILQIDDLDSPSHIVAPALHKNKEQIRDVFQEKLGYEGTEKPHELTLFAREKLREEFLQADVGITGCNFAVSESGSISLVTNEGNARMVSTLPKTQITVMGMERIVPTWEELDVLISLLTRASVGQKLTSYVTVLTGPRLEGEIDGPEDFHLVIVDNGRSEILGTEFQEILHCIRCAACINVCPVYRHIGGHSYGSIYPGPVGAVLTPFLGGYEDYKELPYASSLCGACTEVCPVKIPLHEQLILHRKKIVEEEGKADLGEKMMMKGFEAVAKRSKMFHTATNLAPTLAKPFTKDDTIQKGPFLLRHWTEARNLPAPQKVRFRDWYRRREKGVAEE